MGLLSNPLDNLARGKTRSKSDASSVGNLNISGHGHGEAGNSGSGDSDDPNDTTKLDEDQGNVLMSIIQQLRPGMDLSKIALPTFVLEPRSLLERITDFFSHPELIFGAGNEPDAKERFLRVMTYYLSGWHIKPKGVKKPYNPVLGEFFRCTYVYPDGTEAFYVAEQVSHHPPVSAFFYISPKHDLLVTGELKPKSKFLGNSAATIMEGEDRIRLLNRPEDGEYRITMPNTYARGILFGKMTLELCDVSSVSNDTTDYHCDVDFKAKGWISGGYNGIGGHVKGPGRKELGELSGHWSSAMEYHDKKSGKQRVLFDPAQAKIVPKNVLPEAEQEENESRRLWAKLTDAIKSADMHGATAAKSAVEDRQRELARKREASGEGAPASRFFVHADGDRWMPKIGVDSLPKDQQQMEDAVRKWIFGDKSPTGGSPSSTSTSTMKSPSQQPNQTSAMPAQSTPRPAAPVQSTPQSTIPTQSAPPSAVPLSATSSVTSTTSTGVVPPPPAVTTAPGPPAPGPKLTHPPTSA